MGLFGPTAEERRLARKVARLELERDRALKGWENALRGWIDSDLIWKHRIGAMELNVPPGKTLDEVIKEERERLKLRGLLKDD